MLQSQHYVGVFRAPCTVQGALNRNKENSHRNSFYTGGGCVRHKTRDLTETKKVHDMQIVLMVYFILSYMHHVCIFYVFEFLFLNFLHLYNGDLLPLIGRGLVDYLIRVQVRC
jgi:hypothetical protein